MKLGHRLSGKLNVYGIIQIIWLYDIRYKNAKDRLMSGKIILICYSKYTTFFVYVKSNI